MNNTAVVGMNVTTLKYLAMVVLFATTFITSLLPLRLINVMRNTMDGEKRVRYIRATNLLNCFGAGVFLGATLLDLIPDAMRMYRIVPLQFPFVEFSIAVGFLIMLTIEQIILSQKEIIIDSLTPVERLEARSIELERDTLQRNLNNPQEESSRVTLIKTLQEQELEQQSCFYAFFLLASLSLHALYEGFKLGLQLNFDVLVDVLISLLNYRVPMAFSLGLNMMSSELNLKYVFYLTFWYSLMSPIGLAIAHGFEDRPYDNMIRNVVSVNYVIQALATGIFMFVIFAEILPKEVKRGRNRLIKLFFIVLGFAVICLAMLWKMECPPLDDATGIISKVHDLKHLIAKNGC